MRIPDNIERVEELLPYSKLKNKKKYSNNRRLAKKFNKYWYRYIPLDIQNKFLIKLITRPIKRIIYSPSKLRDIFTVEVI